MVKMDPLLAPLARAFEKDRDVTVGKMFASVGLKVNGKLFAMVVRGRLVVKLPRPHVDELVASGAGERFDPGHGRLMKEWASVREGPSWLDLARAAHRFVKKG
jgi:TfoX/Sxy family transcriptional regulator of competence genes